MRWSRCERCGTGYSAESCPVCPIRFGATQGETQPSGFAFKNDAKPLNRESPFTFTGEPSEPQGGWVEFMMRQHRHSPTLEDLARMLREWGEAAEGISEADLLKEVNLRFQE